MKNTTHFAEQQLIGYLHAKSGYGLIDLIINMGLSKKEWIEINEENDFNLTDQEKTEVEEHFNKKVFS